MPRLLRLTLVVLAVLALLHCQLTEGKKPSKSSSSKSKSTLVNVQIVSRHGTRAPNPVVQQICPTERDNLARYGDLRLTLAGLTGTGQRQLYALGMYTRQTYIERTYPGFLSDFFNDEEVYFRAVGEDRTIQSAVCMGHGMYPKGTAAVGYFADLPSPVPVYTLPDKYDALLEVRKEDCAPRLKKDAAKWDEDEGIKLYQANEPLIQRMLDMCNITDLNEVIVGSGDNYGDAIKDITDAWTFDMNEGFPPIAGLNYSSLLEFRTMAVKQLLGRIIGTEEQIVYMNGQLPERMITNFHTAIANQGAPPASTHRLKMYAYHGHREMMYALGALLGIDYDIDFPGLPKGAIPPGTTLFFELHYHGELLEDGSIPNAWEAANMTNPYLHRMVLPADLPPVRPKFGAKPAAMTNSAWQDANKEKKHPEKNGDDDEDDDGKTKTISPHHPRAPADKTPTRTGEDELNHVDPKDRPTKGTIPTNTSDSNVASSSSSSNSSSHHSVLPHPSLHKKSPLVKVSDDRMPPPPVQHYTVRAYLWHPCGVGKIEEDESSKNTKQNKESKKRRLAKLKGDGDDDDDDSYAPSREADCPSVPVKMSAICDSYECSMEDFQTKLESRIQRTGTWDELCGVPPSRVHKVAADVAAVEQLSKGDVERPTATRMTMVDTTSHTADVPTKSHSLRWFLLLVVAFLAFAGYSKYRSMSPTGSPREEYISYTQNEFDEAAPLQRIY